MKHLKRIAVVAMAAAALAATLGAGTASATTLEIGGVPQNNSVALTLTLKSGTTFVTQTTAGGVNNTCTESLASGSTASPYSGATVTMPVSTLMFSNCSHQVTFHKVGTLHIEHIPGTTNGTLTSSGAEWTSYSTIFGMYLNCKTGTGTHLGVLTGTASGHATVQANAALNCGFVSVKGEYSYVVTSPTGLGVSA